MKASTRARILAVPGMRTTCDLIVNLGNRHYCNAASKRMGWLLEEIRSKRSKDRCFIVGSGPSLTESDLGLISGEDCFAANHMFRLFGRTAWRPKYYVLQDRYTQLDRPLESIECSYMFLGSYFMRKSELQLPRNAFLYYDKRDLGSPEFLSFSSDVSKYVSVNYTVTYSMIQIAVSLGYRSIYLLGIDHSYAIETDSKGVVIGRNDVKNHVYEDRQEVVANVRGMERAYRSAKHYADSHLGIEIVNATRGGKLEIFPRESLEAILCH